MIIAKNLKKVYAPKKGVQVNALDDVSLKLPDTGMVFILGKSGSGKSTLLNVLGGLDTFDSGEIIIKDQSSKEFKQSHFDSYRNTYVGFIFQEYNILEDFTVGANIALAIELQGRKATNEEINQILAEVDLAGLGSRKPNELSGGQKQRVAIARALVKKPEIIMADEPTGALDSNTGRQVFDTLKELSKTKLVLIVSHDREFSELYADRIIELADGKIISDVEYDVEASENTEEPNLTYAGKEITIKDGYELTEDDIVSINQYIKKIKSGATLVVNDKRREKIFKKTDENSIIHKVGDKFKLIKSKLSIKNAFKLGSSGLKHKKVRLVFTILLSFIAFSLFGLADVVASYDNISTCTSSLVDSSIDYASFIKEAKYYYNEDEDDFYWETWGKMVSSTDLEQLKNSTGPEYIGVVGGDVFSLDFNNHIASMANSSRFSGIVPLTQSLIDEFGYSLIAGKIPENDNQIVITKYIAENFVKQGFLQYNKETHESEVVSISSPQDMVGKKLTMRFMWQLNEEDYEIVGVIDTGFDTSRYETLASADDNGLWGMALYEELRSAQSYSLNAVVFSTPNFALKMSSLAQSNKSNLPRGEFRVIRYKNNDWALDDENNVIQGNGYNTLKKLSSMSADSISWIGAPKTALLENQVLIPYDQISWYMGNNSGDVDIWSIELKGEEADIGANYGYGAYLSDFMYNFNGFYSRHYVEKASNWVDIEKALKKYCNVDDITSFFVMWDSETEQDVFDKEQAKRYFAENVTSSIYCPNSYFTGMKDFYNQVMDNYPQAKSVMIDGDELAKSYITLPNNMGIYNCGISLMRDSFFENARNIATVKFAIEKFPDAYAAAKAASDDKKPSWFSTSEYATDRSQFDNYKNAINSLYWSESTEDFEKAFADEFKKYCSDYAISSLSPELFGNIAISCKSDYSKPSTEYRNAEIVGVVFNSQCVVVADSLYNNLVDMAAEGEYAYAVAPMPKDRGAVENLVTFYYTNSFYDGDVRFSLENSVTSELSMIDDILEILGQVFLYVGLGFALFASLMLSNFIATSISYKKQEIGILRAIGSRSRDVFMIFFAESFIIAMINFVLSIVTTGVVVAVLNNIFREDIGLLITFLNFGIRQIILLLGVSLIVALIATFLPVKKIASMKPIDAIKNRK